MSAERKRLIRLIHVAQRDLQMAEDTYRAIIAKYTKGKISTAECSVTELERILTHCKKAGFKIRVRKDKSKATRSLADDTESKKVRALWLFLHELGAVKNPSEAALATYVKRLTGVDALQWVSGKQVAIVIETLKKWAMRYLPARIDALLVTANQYPMTQAERDEINGVVRLRHRKTYDPSLKAYDTLSAFIQRHGGTHHVHTQPGT